MPPTMLTERARCRGPASLWAATCVLVHVAASCAPGLESTDAGTVLAEQAPCPAIGLADDFLEVSMPSTVTNAPVATELVDVTPGEWSGRIVPLLREGEEVLQLRVPSAVADSAPSSLPTGLGVKLRFWDLSENVRDSFHPTAALQLLSLDGELVLEGGIRPLGERFEPAHWGAEATRCVGDDGRLGTDTRYALPADSEPLPLRDVALRTVEGREFIVFQGSSTVLPVGDEDCADCADTPTSVIAFVTPE